MGVSSVLDTLSPSAGGCVDQLIEMNVVVMQKARKRHLFCAVGGQPTQCASTGPVDRSHELFSSAFQTEITEADSSTETLL